VKILEYSIKNWLIFVFMNPKLGISDQKIV